MKKNESLEKNVQAKIKTNIELQQISTDLQEEELPDAWISSHPSSQALLMSLKKQNRFEKMKEFNGFVLEQNSETGNEFTQFLHYLKQSAHEIPSETRIQLVVLTTIVDPHWDKNIYNRGFQKGKHWTTVDILIDEHHEISSFVLDGANSFGFKGIHNHLKQMFPSGKHYIYFNDTIRIGNTLKQRSIQTREIGCRVFAIEHAKQLSQINTDILYKYELPKIANVKKQVYPENFLGQLKLTRIFRGMQTWSGLNSFRPEIQNTILKTDSRTENPITLIESAKSRSIQLDKIEYNHTIQDKNKKYIIKKREFVQNLSQQMLEKIINNRQGFNFLTHPILFKLNSKLVSIDNELHSFTLSLKLILESTFLSAPDTQFTSYEMLKMNELIENLQSYGSINAHTTGNKKQEILLTFADFYGDCHISKNIKELLSLTITPFIQLNSTINFQNYIQENFQQFLKVYLPLQEYVHRQNQATSSPLTKFKGFFKYSAQDKLQAANWFLSILTAEKSYTEQDYQKHKAVLNSGQLKAIFKSDEGQIFFNYLRTNANKQTTQQFKDAIRSDSPDENQLDNILKNDN